MASFEQRELVPDEKILSAIFSGAPGVTRTSCIILSNTFDTCTEAPRPFTKDDQANLEMEVLRELGFV
jgi:hypothetical protein